MSKDTRPDWLTPTRRRLLTGAGATAGMSLAGCTNSNPSGGGEEAGDGGDPGSSSNKDTVVSIGITNGGWDLVPARDTDFDSNKVYTLIYDNVVNLNSDGEPVPDLAADWIRESDTQFIFNLEEGVTFHNGESFTAEDIKYTYDWIQTNENPRKNYLDTVEDVIVEDETTVRFDLSEQYAPFLYKIHAVMWPLSETAINKYGDEYNQNPVGTGPFELVSWESGNTAVLEKYEDYWEHGEANIDRIEFRILPQDSSKVAQLEFGSIDLLDRMPPQFTERVANSDGASVITTGGVSSGRIDFNTDVEPLGDRNVRRAIAWALDKSQITQTVLQGYGNPAKSVLPDSFPQYNDSISDFNHPTGDPQQAQSLLSEAGYSDLSFQIKTSTSSRHKRTATLVQSMLDQIGISTEIQSLEGNAFFDQETQGDYEIAVSNWTWFGDPDTLVYLYHTEGLNVWNISNDELNGLLEEQRRVVDPQERQAVLNEIQQIVYEEAYSVYTYYPQRVQAISDRIKGYEQYANGSFRSLDSASVD